MKSFETSLPEECRFYSKNMNEKKKIALDYKAIWQLGLHFRFFLS